MNTTSTRSARRHEVHRRHRIVVSRVVRLVAACRGRWNLGRPSPERHETRNGVRRRPRDGQPADSCGGNSHVTITPAKGKDWTKGVRALELADLRAAPGTVTVTAINRVGGVIDERPLRYTLHENELRVITVMLARPAKCKGRCMVKGAATPRDQMASLLEPVGAKAPSLEVEDGKFTHAEGSREYEMASYYFNLSEARKHLESLGFDVGKLAFLDAHFEPEMNLSYDCEGLAEPYRWEVHNNALYIPINNSFVAAKYDAGAVKPHLNLGVMAHEYASVPAVRSRGVSWSRCATYTEEAGPSPTRFATRCRR